jgi:hypothetical protein
VSARPRRCFPDERSALLRAESGARREGSAHSGPALASKHSHQIRRIAEVTNVSDWGGVSVGALYRDLRVMRARGWSARSERSGSGAGGTPDELKRRVSGDVVTLRVGGAASAAATAIGGLPGVREASAEQRSLRLTVDNGEEALPGLLRTLDQAAITLESIQLARPTLDDVFLTLTGRSLREDIPAGPPADRPLAAAAQGGS